MCKVKRLSTFAKPVRHAIFQVDTHVKLRGLLATHMLLYNIHSQCTIMHIEMLSIGRAIQILGGGKRTEKSSLQISIYFLQEKNESRENHAEISNSFLVGERELNTAVGSPSLQKAA